MKITNHRYDHPVNIYNLGDCHRGDIAFNKPVFDRVVNQILEDENAVWVSTGDMLNVALKTSLSNSYTSLNLDKEMGLLTKELEPIAHKCLGIVGSNHHARFDKAVGMSLDKLLCREMMIPYLGNWGIIKVTCGRLSYFVSMIHGVGGGSLKGGKINNIVRASSVYPCLDLYLSGHVHDYMTTTSVDFYLDRKRDAIVEQTSLYATTGAFLDWSKSYAVRLQYKPGSMGSTMVSLAYSQVGRNSNKKMTVQLVS